MLDLVKYIFRAWAGLKVRYSNHEIVIAKSSQLMKKWWEDSAVLVTSFAMMLCMLNFME